MEDDECDHGEYDYHAVKDVYARRSVRIQRAVEGQDGDAPKTSWFLDSELLKPPLNSIVRYTPLSGSGVNMCMDGERRICSPYEDEENCKRNSHDHLPQVRGHDRTSDRSRIPSQCRHLGLRAVRQVVQVPVKEFADTRGEDQNRHW